MALTLEDALRRQQLEEALSHLDTGATALEEPDDAITDYPAASAEAPPVSKEEKKHASDYHTWDTATDEPVTASDYPANKKVEDVYPTIAQDQGASDRYPTIASDQPAGLPREYPNISPPPPEPADIQVDPDTGTRYVQDPLEGKIPHAEIATAADKQAFKPSDVTLPEITATDYGAPISVRRGEEWREPWHPSAPDPTQGNLGDEELARQILTETPVKRKSVPGFVESSQNAIVNPAAGVVPPTSKPKYPDQIVTPEEASGAKSIVNAPAATPEVRKAEPVATPTPTVTGDLAKGPPGTNPNGTENEPFWPGSQWNPSLKVEQLPPGSQYIDPKDGSQKTTPGIPAAQPVVQQGGQIGVADYFSKRGDKPISSADDPRLTTVTVGDQKYRVNKEAAPYFQGFLNELAEKGAPVKAGDSWVFRNKVGAKGLSDHAYGGAIDVNQGSLDRNKVSPEFRKWIDDHPGLLQDIEKRWNIYGGEKFGDLGHFEWGGAAFKQTAQQPAAQAATQPAEKPTVQPAAKVSAAAQSGDWNAWDTPDGPAPAAKEADPKEISTVNPDGTQMPGRIQAVGGKDPVAIVMHHTGDHHTASQTKAVLDERGLGVEITVDRAGNVVQIGNAGAQNIKSGWGPKGTGLNNSNVIGIEVAAYDDKDVLPVQVQAVKNYLAKYYPNTNVFGHGEINPGHKEADEGMTIVSQIRADRAGQGGDTATASVGDTGQVLQNLNDSGLNATHFGYKGDANLDPASGRGEGAYVSNMISGYDVALNRAAWEKVGKPNPGEEFTFAGRTWRYGDKVPELYKDARFDIFDKGNQIFSGGQLGRPAAAADEQPKGGWESWDQAAPADVQASQESATKIQGFINGLVNKYKDADNLGVVYKDVDNNTDVPENLRNLFKARIHDQMIEQMVGYDPDLQKLAEKDPEKAKMLAWAKWHNPQGEIIAPSSLSMNPGASNGINSDSLRDLWTKVVGMHEELTNQVQGNPVQVAKDTIRSFYKFAGLDSEQKQKDFLDRLHGMSVEDQYKLIQDSLPHGPNGEIMDSGGATPAPMDVINSLGHIADSKWVLTQQEEFGKKVKAAATKIAGDPRMRATLGGSTGDTAAAIAQMAEMEATGEGIAPLLMAIQAGDAERAKIKKEHPDWTSEQVDSAAVGGTIANSFGMALGGKIIGSIVGPFMKGIGNPVARRLANAGASAVTGGTLAAGGSVVSDVARGQPVDWEQAKKQGVQMGVIAGITGLAHSPEGRAQAEAPPTPVVSPNRVPVERQLEHVPVHEYDFEHIPADETRDDRGLKHGRIWEHVPDDTVLRDDYTGSKSSSYNDNDGNITEINGRNQQIAERSPLLLGDRTAADQTERRPPPLVREPETPRAAQPSGGAGDSRAAPPQPDIFRPPRRAATNADEALAQVKGYHDEHLKLVQAMGWEHDPTQQPMAHVRPDGRTIFIGGAAEHYIEQAKAHGITDPAKQVEFARKGMDEEITHGLDFHSMRDEYDARKAAGEALNGENFHVWASNEARRAMREMFSAHDQAVAAKDHRLAKMIRDAFDYSNKAYHYGALNWGELKKFTSGKPSKIDGQTARDHLFRARMELARQMDQASRRGEITESSTLFQKVARGLSQWIKKIVGHFKRTHSAALQGKLGERFQRHLQGIINKRRSLDAMAHGARPPMETKGAFDRPSDRTPPPAEIQKPAYVPKNWKERLAYRAQMAAAKAGTLHSTLVKSGESFGLDHPTTERLGRELRNQPVYRQKIFQVAKIADLSRAFKAPHPWERAAIGKEFSNWFDARERGQPLPPLSPKAKDLVDSTNVTLNRLGQIATNMGIKVVDEHGKAHPFTVIKDYFPRILSKHTEDVFEHRDGTHKAEFDALYADALRKGVAKSRDEFIQKFEHATVPDVTSNAFFGNAEHTRTMHLPLEMHDRSPDAILRYVSRMTDRLSDIKAFGQKLNPSTKDLFDHTNEAVAADQTLTPSQKQMMGARVNQERNAAYARHFVDNFSGISGKGRSLAASTALGNWFSSANNLVGGAGSNVSYGGPVSAAKAYGKMLHKYFSMKADTEDRGILSNNLRDMMGDFAKTGDVGWLTRGRQGYNRAMMELGGQNATENINRTAAAQQAKYLLQKFQKWGAPGADKGVMGARARDRINFFKNRGFTQNELDALWHEGGDPDKHYGDRFIKNYVLDSHGSYSPGQTASHIFDSPTGKLLLQFQKFGANQWRMQSREFLVPMGRAFAEVAKNPKSSEALSDAGYQFARNLINFAIVLPATGLAANTLLGLVKNKKGEEASWVQLGKELQSGQYGRAAWHYFGKMMQAYTLAGMTGPVANYAGIALSELGITRGRIKDPRNPALLSVMIQPMWDYLKGASEIAQGDVAKFPAALADSHLLGKLFTQVSGLRAMYQAAGGIEQRMGVDDPWIHAGRDVGNANNMAFVRSRVKMYEEAHPELTRSNPPTPVKNEFSPYREDLQNDLLSGDAKGALAKVQEYLKRFPPAEAMARLKKIQDSVASSIPVKPGGSTKAETQLDFIHWLQETQSPEDARQIFNLSQTYAKTAIATGIFGNATMGFLAGLNYDKIPKAPVIKPSAQATMNAAATKGGQHLIDALAKKEMALQLQHH